MSKQKKDEKTIMPKASKPRKLIAYLWCMMFGDVLNLFMLHINDHNQDKEHADTFDGMDRALVKM
jgi:hypothetical protein